MPKDFMSTSNRDNIAARLNDITALKKLGAMIIFDTAGSAIVSIDRLEEFHTGGLESKAINGLTLMGLLDTAMCAASLHRLGDDARCATVEISVKFIKPVLGTSIRAHGRVISRTNDILFCEAFMIDDRKRIRVIATGVIQKLRNRREIMI